ncbi:hypothetical protein GWK47_015750 [Chionoecetes opilio]|uniref:Uncharacterized protein n=1 Tax=Chionoecetes opilio TaxID=41210 RepID=A0A8J5CI72_CHIOP|nr:hypothetical protein GWK47_015750 [Chionoecetes opilio]
MPYPRSGEKIGKGISMFPRFTGDKLPLFRKGKTDGRWNAYVEGRRPLKNFMITLFMMDSEIKQIPVVERFTVIITKRRAIGLVNEARRGNLPQKNRPKGKKFPPTQEALLQHTLRQLPKLELGPMINVSRTPKPRGLWRIKRCNEDLGPFLGQPLFSTQACSERSNVVQKRHVRRTMLIKKARGNHRTFAAAK